MNKRVGFTLVEIIVIVGVLGVLLAMSLYGLSTIQEQGRDAKRKANATVIVEALEKYYDKNGYYPGCTSMTAAASTVTQNTLIGIDRAALLTPNAGSGLTNSIQCVDMITSSGTDYFAYVVDTSAGCQTGNACADWTLKYRVEEDDSIASIQSRR